MSTDGASPADDDRETLRRLANGIERGDAPAVDFEIARLFAKYTPRAGHVAFAIARAHGLPVDAELADRCVAEFGERMVLEIKHKGVVAKILSRQGTVRALEQAVLQWIRWSAAKVIERELRQRAQLVDEPIEDMPELAGPRTTDPAVIAAARIRAQELLGDLSPDDQAVVWFLAGLGLSAREAIEGTTEPPIAGLAELFTDVNWTEGMVHTRYSRLRRQCISRYKGTGDDAHG